MDNSNVIPQNVASQPFDEEIQAIEQNRPKRAAHIDGAQIGTLRICFIMAGLWTCLFLSALETTIVSTALQTISSDLQDLSKSTWIVVAYLLTYNGFLILFSKLTDIFGQKSLLIMAQCIFLVFSMACGAAQTMTQLIIFRALQGIGGSGIYSIVFVIIGKIGTVEKMPLYMGAMTSVFAIASLLGPILGGAIVDHTTWRWVFFLNGPGVAISLLILVPAIPNLGEKMIEKEKLRRIDVIGGLLSLAWPILLIFALEEGGQAYPWKSSVIIGTLVGSGVGIFVFGIYEQHVQKQAKQEPMLPIGLLKIPALCLKIIIMFTMGGCFYAAIILLPQRFQAVNGISAERAGINLLPFTIVSPVFSGLCGVLLAKYQKSVGPVLFISSVFTVVGIAMLGTLSSDTSGLEPKVYGFELILAIGLGLMMPPIFFFIKVEYDDSDFAAIMGATNTARTLGGCVAVAICSAILHADLKSHLNSFLSPSQIEAVLSSTSGGSTLTAHDKIKLQQVYGASYNTQFRALLAFAGLNLLSAAVLLFDRRRKASRSKG
ncbi:Major facilitator superfamily domain, general substrate transporter [Penicillium expansum]|uniref:Major facilitator superfamily domain, general substrate transporter n=1 Tax=Penicillium expansum TaxID=27334 RepID=A0A0A2IBA7_PENEN|nr:Major facilitator superfamily domain, general substrate transporter [Penicillium expansum]KGO37543.1 Major facilitator superfamily domain, general substrate transporter [Penicillium expansum]KGO40392.1 Major facilitator superfamily domain, general substrate transporter [Penicillium expansum]KGO59265.1 Major facilitator superfamily domain, general substrate transporter [Penicillium expansum]